VLTVGITSTTLISVIRLQSLVQFSSSTNPTYDNVPTAYWSVLEAFTGIFCVCMPALRRLLAYVSPYCFGTTKNDSKYEQYNTPNKVSNGMPRNSRAGMRSGISGGKNSGITKTIDTQIETRVKEDDEIELVQFQNTQRS
jgi:hypothetical protein